MSLPGWEQLGTCAAGAFLSLSLLGTLHGTVYVYNCDCLGLKTLKSPVMIDIPARIPPLTFWPSAGPATSRNNAEYEVSCKPRTQIGLDTDRQNID